MATVSLSGPLRTEEAGKGQGTEASPTAGPSLSSTSATGEQKQHVLAIRDFSRMADYLVSRPRKKPDMGPNCERAYKEVKQVNLVAKNAMMGVPESFPGRHDILVMATAWDEDPIEKSKDLSRLLGALPPAPPEQADNEFHFLRRNPIYCDLWVHTMRYKLHYHTPPRTRRFWLLSQGPEVGGAGALPQDAGQLDFFVGDPPTDLEGYFRNYSLSIGNSITNWARNTSATSSKKTKVNLDNRRNMRNMGWASKKAEANTPAGVIRELALAIQAEIPEITFDYFAMHAQCFIQAPDQAQGQENLLHLAVGYVFSTASGHTDFKEKTFGTRALLDAAVDVMTKFLKEGNGDKIITAGEVYASEVRRLDLSNIGDRWGKEKPFQGHQAGGADVWWWYGGLYGRSGRGGLSYPVTR
ncbi:hypothetical protein B0H66DRAFT_589295 [Apodospora peruviana]|uniref:Uncharacterized protein n=1 Tax=Apodospora peruviana TaxID=516989 RepID=A0AAE0MBW0_9PEZI|nr:hypothetical protein B0H66DRAFT_589295 [Apodospora peruviana]